MVFFSSKASKIFNNTNLDFIITSRLNGFSQKPYESLNIAYHVEDNPQNVEKNRKKIIQNFFPNKQLVWLNQIHSNIVLQANQKGLLGDGDGILCNNPSYVAMIMVADCIPICVFDSKNNIFTLLHAGRKGVFQNILQQAILQMQEQYHTETKDLLLYIGPHLKSCCYEVQQDVILELQKLYPQLYQDFIQHKNNKTFLNLDAMIFLQLKNLGIKPQQFETSMHCTFETKELFSYRREKTTGRFALFATLKTAN